MKLLTALMVVCVILGLTGGAIAGNSATTTIVVRVLEINELSMDGSISLIIDSAVAGQKPDDAVDTATYNITTNGSNKRITGRINTVMPDGVTLSVNVAAPINSGSSKGFVELTSTDADLVTGITRVAESGLDMTFRLSASLPVRIVSQTSTIVTLTVTDDS